MYDEPPQPAAADSSAKRRDLLTGLAKSAFSDTLIVHEVYVAVVQVTPTPLASADGFEQQAQPASRVD